MTEWRKYTQRRVENQDEKKIYDELTTDSR
jgi:hypothetical protein